MATQHRKETNILLTFKVLQFVNQVRRRVKTRFPDGSSSICQLGTGALGSRTPNRISNRTILIDRQPASHPRGPQSRVCKSHRNRVKRGNSVSIARASASDVSARSDAPGGQVQHMISAVDELGREKNTALSTVASNNGLFLNHDNYPTIEGYSLNELIRLLITVQEAITALTACRSQYGDRWLLDQGLDLGLILDETFIANYEHLLLRLRAELADALTRKTVEELLRGGHDKRQRKLLAWFSEFAEKPRPLSTSFPWTIKPSLAVLWGVCWMFYDREAEAAAAHDAKGGNDRVRRDRVLRKMDFPNVQWSAPASSDYVNFGLELIGAQPLHGTQQPSQRTVDAGLDGMFQARNADTWESDLSPLEPFRLPSDAQVGAIGHSRYAAPPQLPNGNTYYQQDLALLQNNSPVDNYLPHNPGSPLTAFAHLGTDNSLNLAWQQLPRNSLPHQDPRNLVTPQPPSIRVTSECDFTQPPGDFVPTFGVGYQSRIYHNPQAPPQLNTSFDFSIPYNNMVSQISPEAPPSIQIPQIHTKHERTHSINSVSGMPTPASMSGQRSPLPSPTSGPSPHLVASPRGHIRRVSEDVSSVTSEEDGVMRKNHSYKRSEEPPRNSEGKMYCRYSECAGQLFDRKCEWSKHMDKHDRPYKCNVKGCEKLQGFTYSGGLLRHEREVHKMHGGTKKSLFCPFPDCKRSSGAGFTRKENLAEHVRRVHRRTSMSADMHGLIIRRDTMEASPIPESRRASESPYVRNIEYRDDELPLKRKRGSDAGLSDRDNDELRAEIKRLRQENEDKDSRLQSLEQAVIALQHQARR